MKKNEYLHWIDLNFTIARNTFQSGHSLARWLYGFSICILWKNINIMMYLDIDFQPRHEIIDIIFWYWWLDVQNIILKLKMHVFHHQNTWLIYIVLQTKDIRYDVSISNNIQRYKWHQCIVTNHVSRYNDDFQTLTNHMKSL